MTSAPLTMTGASTESPSAIRRRAWATIHALAMYASAGKDSLDRTAALNCVRLTAHLELVRDSALRYDKFTCDFCDAVVLSVL